MNDKILLDHGSGGLATRQLIEDVFLEHLDNPVLSRMEDSAILDLPQGKVAFTTDSFVIDPIFFPGGDIGSLSVHGTVNDLAMQGAKPRYLSLGLIIEEGLELETLKRVAASIGQAAKVAGVLIAAADTKVVGKGQADKIFINTSGIGVVPERIDLGIQRARPGDVVIVSGSIGDHGAAILLARSGLPFHAEIKSDSAPLADLVHQALSAVEPDAIRLFRDATRGGVATVLNEIALASGVEIEIDEGEIPVDPDVGMVCELLGLDPLYLANEGKCVAVVSPEGASRVLEAMRGTSVGRAARIIGEVKEAKGGPRVKLVTRVGGSRIVPILSGEPLPRIC
ncbi:MAG: hydrogenase expression/formation protein HypE [Thermodesulfobacteria bacterium]|nr:hydrogenase expression/formation protein HypE [Thermodesulfobacteriota bacterium]